MSNARKLADLVPAGLDLYEIGTWTLSNGNFGTFSSVTSTAKYIKIGNLVFVQFSQTGGTIDPTGGPKYLHGLPFAPISEGGGGSFNNGGVSMNVNAFISVAAGTGRIWCPSDIGPQTSLFFSGSYYTS